MRFRDERAVPLTVTLRCSAFTAVRATAIWLALGSQPLTAQDLRRSVRIVADNDYFIFWVPPGRRSDDNYTQGLSASWDAARVPSHGRRLVCWKTAGCGTTVDIGQEMYTPTNDASTPLPNERPYAGWLYGRFSVRTGDTSRYRSIGMTLGVTGPASYAEDVQLAFHRMIPGFRRPLGWDYQLANEVAFAVRAERAWRLAPSTEKADIVDLVPSILVNVGTLRSSMSAGARARIGFDLDHPWLVTSPGHVAAFYLLCELRGEMVAHDLFLDGSTYRSSLRVQRRPMVAEGAWGLAARVRSLALEYRAVARSQDYRTGPRVHRYGSVGMRWVLQ